MKPRSQRFLDRLAEGVILGDGAVGTLLLERGVQGEISYEELNLNRPDIVTSISFAYVAVGAEVLETNSFCANYPKQHRFGLESKVREMARKGAELARSVAGEDRFVAGSVGPLARRRSELEEFTNDEVRGFFRETMEALAEGGADLLMLETFSMLRELERAVEAAQGLDLPIVAQMAFGDEGTTEMGITAERAARRLKALGVDVIGSNCRSGPHVQVGIVERQAAVVDVPLSVYPNAGYAEQRDGRYVYGASPRYFAEKATEMINAGAHLIGGCCGTTPEHIRMVHEAIAGLKPPRRKKVGKKIVVQPEEGEQPVRHGGEAFMSRFHTGEPFVTVEIEPPRGVVLKNTIEGARMAMAAGADTLNVPDNALAHVRMDNMVFAQILRDRVEAPVILHLTCRDKNLIAIQSDLLGAQIAGIESILAVTGDPASIGDQPGASSVYDVTSIGLIEMISSLNRGFTPDGVPLEKPTDFAIGVAFNPNVSGEKGLVGAMFKLKKKIRAGAQFAETQPIYDPTVLRNFLKVSAQAEIPFVVGIMPIVSRRNADFLHNEVPGIRISKEIRQRFEGLSRREGEKEGLRISKEIIDIAMENGVRNFYIVPPLARYEVAAELSTHIRQKKS